MILRPVNPDNSADVVILYDLLKQREPHQCISHKTLPTYQQHAVFVRSNPYLAWYLIQDGARETVGSIYLSKRREIGIFIFKYHQGKDYGSQAVKALMNSWPGKFLANIAPHNIASMNFFEKLGAKHIQNTYKL